MPKEPFCKHCGCSCNFAERRIVQIAAIPVSMGLDKEGFTFIQEAERVFALCNDGSVWQIDHYKKNEWKRLPSIPQDA